MDSVSYEVCDLGSPKLCDTATLILFVDSVNDDPIAVNDTVSTPQGTAATAQRDQMIPMLTAI